MTNKHGFEEVLNKANLYLDEEALGVLKQAYEFADKAHEGQRRQSKKPYITHPIAVASILCELEQELDTIIAGILHDTVEDTDVTSKQIEETFGKKVSVLVDGVTKLNKLKFHSQQEAQAENYRRMFLAMAEDYRVIIIKLADRLHNMKTLQFLVPEKQKRIAKETLEIYGPLAHRLGIYTIKWQLEDIAFRYIYPEKYTEVKELVEQTREERETFVENIILKIHDQLDKEKISSSIKGRPKHLYSIYQKLDKKNTTIHQLYDLTGIRVIVEKVEHCYGALGIIHSHFKPISERFKDYIAISKPNGYQSLHTTVLTDDGKSVEIQIRTKEMHQIAEFGFAAHWQYKQSDRKKQLETKLKWLNNILEHQDENLAPNDYLQTLKMDLFVNEVFAFTPKGDLKVLSRGSTALDFAYSIHTEVGHTCKSAIVNGKIVQLGYELNNGDRVEIITSKQSRPTVDWLRLVNSRHSRYKIKQFLNSQNKEDSLEAGKNRLKRAFVSEGLIFETCLNEINQNEFYDRFNVSKVEDLYVYVAQGDLSPREVLRYISKKLKKDTEPNLSIKDPNKKTKKMSGGIYVMGEKNVKFTLAKCCMPIPGDDIMGIVVIGKGVSIHRQDCLNIASIKADSPERLLDVQWDIDRSKPVNYTCTLRIEGYDREGLLQDLLSIIYESKVNLREVRTKINADNTRMFASITIDISDIKQFYDIKRNLNAIEDVYSVSRVSLGLEK
ncbi:MAG: (p)ppGpp synthetase [Rickettsiales bacterium]|nr:(p)ppGpp synthetase [Rickettsiales bacterium]|tara:strand:+ start:2720 stop:4894 length:2175 start_codon:yes stop_codon:yes gene_type:complete